MGKNRQRQQQKQSRGGGSNSSNSDMIPTAIPNAVFSPISSTPPFPSETPATGTSTASLNAAAGNNNGSNNTNEIDNNALDHDTGQSNGFLDRLTHERTTSFTWILGSALLGLLFGFGVGTGHLTGELSLFSSSPDPKVTPWRRTLGKRVRSSPLYRTFKTTRRRLFHSSYYEPNNSSPPSSLFSTNNPADNNLGWENSIQRYLADGRGIGNGPRIKRWYNGFLTRSDETYIEVHGKILRDDPSNPRAFAVLREMIVREEGGFVHPDLGLLIPAPCGAGRGLGMVRDSWTSCQTRCFPGTFLETLKDDLNTTTQQKVLPQFRENITSIREMKAIVAEQQAQEPLYSQEEVLVRVPLELQMTRNLALQTLMPLIPAEVQERLPLEKLDDASMLVLLLTHERGRGRKSPFLPYIATLPLNPSCGYSPVLRERALETIYILGTHLGMDVNGWSTEISKVAAYAEQISDGLSRDYGQYISIPRGVSAFATIQWALCQVASRAIAGAAVHGALRLVPMMDMINHDVNGGGFVELKGNESLKDGDFVDSYEDDSGTFVVRSMRYGRRKPLKKGQELLATYNLPQYSPLDWFISMGFVPPERSGRRVKIDAALPKI